MVKLSKIVLNGESLEIADEMAREALKNLSLVADNVTYDNSTSGMDATDVQGAIDEVFEKLDLDYTNARSDVQDLKTFLQMTLDKLFGAVYDLLSNAPDIFSAITQTNSKVNINDGLISWSSSSGTSCNSAIYSNDLIDLTPYSTVKITATTTIHSSSYSANPLFFVMEHQPEGAMDYEDAILVEYAGSGSGTATKTIDISDITGSYYIGICNKYTTGSLTLFEMY